MARIHSATSGLTVFLKFAFCFSLCPFYLKKDEANSSITLRKFRFQKVLCVVNNVLGTAWLISLIRKSLFKGLYNVPTYFSCFVAIFSATRRLLLLKTFWSGQTDFLNVVKYLDVCTCLRTENHKFLNSIATWLLCGMYITSGIVSFITGEKLDVGTTLGQEPIGNSSFVNWWLETLFESSRYMLFLKSSPADETQKPNLNNAWDLIILLIGAIAFFQRHMQSFFCDLYLVIITSTFWLATKSFEDFINDISNKTNLFQVETQEEELGDPILKSVISCRISLLKVYQAVLNLSRLFNKLLGSAVALFLVELTIYYSTSFDRVIVRSGIGRGDFGVWWNIGRLLVFSTGTSSVLFFGADGCRKMNLINVWLSSKENRASVPKSILVILQDHIKCNEISIKGTCSFPLTYGIVANVIRHTVIYFIICVQVR